MLEIPRGSYKHLGKVVPVDRREHDARFDTGAIASTSTDTSLRQSAGRCDQNRHPTIARHSSLQGPKSRPPAAATSPARFPPLLSACDLSSHPTRRRTRTATYLYLHFVTHFLTATSTSSDTYFYPYSRQLPST